ncbi:MAG: glycosyltransferase family A protein [Hyphomonadaceae bacterium]|nr:glycosyltransferase family A protein [Hyphomonadaceae bacterium]
MKVSVLIPTFRRPDGFRRAAYSVFAQQGVAEIELIAVDNSPEGAALAAFKELETRTPISFRWAHEPRPGVANARNAALALASGDLVAWLDDDEEAPAHWLAALIAVQESTGAQSVFGPVRAKAGGRYKNFFERLYSRPGPSHSGRIDCAYGIGNSLQPRAMFSEAAPFNASANQTGGEDDQLFAAWRQAGAAFAWAANAWVIEHVAPERTRIMHGVKRAFAYGQGPCELAWAARDYLGLARHMLIGAGQTLVFGLLSAILLLLRRDSGLIALDRAARGAGKVFWFLEQRFYGEAQPA